VPRAPLFACPVGLQFDLGGRSRKLPLTFLDAIGLAICNDFVRPGICLVKDRRRLAARVGDNLVRFGPCLYQSLLATIRSSQAVFDLLLPVLDRCKQRRPDELHTEPDEHEHRYRLAD